MSPCLPPTCIHLIFISVIYTKIISCICTVAPSVGPLPVVELTSETIITVSWSSTDCINQNGPGMITYEARLNNGAVIISTSGTRAVFSNLNPMTSYTIDVRAQNSQGVGPFGTPLTIATNSSGN